MRKYFDNTFIYLFLVFILVCLAYFPQFTGDFIGDDIGRIETFGPSITLSNLMDNALGDRPLLAISLWLDLAVFKMSPGMMRLESIVIFVFIVYFMLLLIQEVARLSALNLSTLSIYSVLLLFSLHPLHTQTIGHLVQRGILLSTFFSLVATLLLLKCSATFGHRKWLLALLFWLLALLSKPNIAFLPIAWVILFHSTDIKVTAKSILPFFAMLAVPVFLYRIGGYNIQKNDDITWLDYFLTEGHVIWIYLRLLFYPDVLKFNHDIVILGKVPFFPGILYWITYVILLALSWIYIPARKFSVFLVIAFLALLPESSVFKIMHAIFEHRTFTPMVFLFCGLPFLIQRLHSKSFSYLFVILAILMGVRTYYRSKEVRYFENWAKVEIGHTCNLGYFILSDFRALLNKGLFETAREGLDIQTRYCKTQTFTNKVSSLILDMAMAKELDDKSYQFMKKVLHSDNELEPIVRNILNDMMVKILVKHYSAEKIDCALEDFYSGQIRVFNREPHLYVLGIKTYLAASNRCLTQIKSSKDESSIFQKDKIRVIHNVYFKKNDPDIYNLIYEKRSDPRYQYLLKLYKDNFLFKK